MSSEWLAREPVRRVQAALDAAGSAARVVPLDQTARTAEDAARALHCPIGAIVKSLVFRAGATAVLALVAGDRRCDAKALRTVLQLTSEVERADADWVRTATGFSIGGVAPIGHLTRPAVAMDSSLYRFATVYAAAGHPHCVFGIAPAELQRIAGAVIADTISPLAN